MSQQSVWVEKCSGITLWGVPEVWNTSAFKNNWMLPGVQETKRDFVSSRCLALRGTQSSKVEPCQQSVVHLTNFICLRFTYIAVFSHTVTFTYEQLQSILPMMMGSWGCFSVAVMNCATKNTLGWVPWHIRVRVTLKLILSSRTGGHRVYKHLTLGENAKLVSKKVISVYYSPAILFALSTQLFLNAGVFGLNFCQSLVGLIYISTIMKLSTFSCIYWPCGFLQSENASVSVHSSIIFWFPKAGPMIPDPGS